MEKFFFPGGSLSFGHRLAKLQSRKIWASGKEKRLSFAPGPAFRKYKTNLEA